MCGTLLGDHTVITHHIEKGEDWERTKSLKEAEDREYTKPDGVVISIGDDE